MSTNDWKNLLACPKCRGELKEEGDALSCPKCAKTYEVRDGIPALVDLDALPPHLHGQVSYFEKEYAEMDLIPQTWQTTYAERFLKHFPDVAGKTVLDCGTGSGYMALALAKRGAEVIACDLTMNSLVQLAKGRDKLGLTNLHLVCCSAEDLPFRSDCFDYFISNAVLEHLPRETEAVAEMDRVMKPSAGLQVTVPLKFTLIWPFFWPVNWVYDRKIGHLRRYDRKMLNTRFGKTGFSELEVYYTGHLSKVIGILTGKLLRIKDAAWYDRIEKTDEGQTAKPYGASNISAYFRRDKRPS